MFITVEIVLQPAILRIVWRRLVQVKIAANRLIDIFFIVSASCDLLSVNGRLSYGRGHSAFIQLDQRAKQH
ncbi:Uncharacterised protein [Vibrio cholerae]|nr:Uncharacterised protein [Vibrio cholerae]CSI21049.1 Uncharacterised protein [Vibrio cholerae]CSI63261.1 Uncharacterised protein [Vibrio cholerae]